jgi:GalNAc-alpha-(1->4)-GalNAc-alpha-(1->3)-diNAcBac-PP-undecaprenol alpha-1,4-N-acetyl-D-galactosaminyltransferase
MRLLFVSRMFDRVAGGVERMAVNIMNAMVERGHEVSLFTWDLAEAEAFYDMRDSIRWHRLDMGHAGRTAGNLLRARRAVKFRRLVASLRPDVVIGFQHGAYLFAEVSLLGLDVPVILAERNAPDRFDHTSEGRYRRIVCQSMRPAAAITVQCESYVPRYPSYLRTRMVVIPNPVYKADGFARPADEKASRTLLSVGRLSFQKNQAAMIEAFALIAERFPEWRLRIVGDGEDRPALEALIEKQGIQRRVSMDGTTPDVSAEYQAADLFCLPSRWEGFPNTLAEAMAHGLPAVAYKQCAGADELIRHGTSGFLADGNGDPATLASMLAALMGRAEVRGDMGARAIKLVSKYDPEGVYDRWELLFQRVGTTV